MTPKLPALSICDANPILADQLLCILQSDEWIAARFCITKVADAFEAFATIKPEILLFDPSQDLVNHKAWQALDDGSSSRTALIGYCNHIPASDARALISRGFRAVVPKTVTGAELVKVVSAVSFNGTYLHESYRENDVSLPQSSVQGFTPPLTERESEVLRQLALGNSMKEIATNLNLSTKTVDTYKIRANRKLDLRSRADIVRYAIQSGWMKETSLPVASFTLG